MIDNDQADDGGDADIDKIAQREVKSRLKILHYQRDKLEIEEVDDQPLHQLVLADRLRRKQDVRQMQRLLAQKYDQNDPQAQQAKIQNGLHCGCNKTHQRTINRRHRYTS